VIHPRREEDEFSSAQQLYIEPAGCIDCGACVPVCPVSAIFTVDDLPGKWHHFAQINRNWYDRRALTPAAAQ
jgi:ferredoxin